MSGLFITATGTDIGKTFIACLLIRQLAAQGRKVHALKPLLTGFQQEDMYDSDSAHILAAMGLPVTMQNIEAITPWRFAAPLAPNMAARLESRPQIDLVGLVRFCNATRQSQDGALLIEGVGGVLAPINDQYTVRDWIAAMDMPALLVTGSYLGSISHTLTALEALQSRDISIAGIVVSESVQAPPLDETLRAISNFARGVRVMAVRRGPGRAEPDLTQLLD